MKIIYPRDGGWVFISGAAGFDLAELALLLVPDGVEWELAEDDDPRLILPGDPVAPHLNYTGLARFSGAVPVIVHEAIRVLSALRVAKGRYRSYHEGGMPSDQYSANVSVLDTRALVARITLRTTAYVEVRVTDLLGVAQDPTEVIIETKRVIYPQ